MGAQRRRTQKKADRISLRDSCQFSRLMCLMNAELPQESGDELWVERKTFVFSMGVSMRVYVCTVSKLFYERSVIA